MKKKKIALLPSKAVQIAFEKKIHEGLAAMAFVPGLNEKIDKMRVRKGMEDIMRKTMSERIKK